MTVTVSKGPPSRLSKKSLLPSRTMTMSHGFTVLGAVIRTLRIASVAYTWAVSAAASYMIVVRMRATIDTWNDTHRLDDRVVRSRSVILDAVQRYKRTLGLGRNAIVLLVVRIDTTERAAKRKRFRGCIRQQIFDYSHSLGLVHFEAKFGEAMEFDLLEHLPARIDRDGRLARAVGLRVEISIA